jgi:hypothetical protein
VRLAEAHRDVLLGDAAAFRCREKVVVFAFGTTHSGTVKAVARDRVFVGRPAEMDGRWWPVYQVRHVRTQNGGSSNGHS